MNVTQFPKASTTTARPAILIVQPRCDDNAAGDGRDLADLVRNKLAYSVNLTQADSMVSALKYLQSGSYIAVFIDARLSQLEALPILHRAAELPRDVAIAIVDPNDDAQGEEWIQRGADDFIVASELSSRRIDMLLAKTRRSRRLRRENAHMHQQIRHAGREFEHFVRALSHDMMANFMLLEGSFSQLQSAINVEAMDEEASHTFAHMDACLAESKRFLNDLVQLAKTGSVEMEPQCVALKQIVGEVLFEQGELIERNGITVDVAPSMPAVWCNRQRVKQIVTNLVRNAIKHGCDLAAPKISISATVLPGIEEMSEAPNREHARSNSMVLLRIYDNGAGIETRMHDEIFLPGKRLPTASEEGSGMGLAIVRKIAEHYGGSSWVDRQTTMGTGIVVSLPAVPRYMQIEESKNNEESALEQISCPRETEHEAHKRLRSAEHRKQQSLRKPIKTPAALHKPHHSHNNWH